MTGRTPTELFGVEKPVIGVLHGRGGSDAEILDTAKAELDIYRAHGVSGALVENYFCTPKQAEMVLDHVARHSEGIFYGINLLDDDALNFKLARDYGVSFMQVDSVCGHVRPEDDAALAAFFARERAKTDALLIGGVRFKYQKYLSGRTLKEDLALGSQRCDAIAVTGNLTGEETDLEKIKEFRAILGGFPLVVAAGLRPDNLAPQFALGDAFIVGSYFKKGHDVKNEMEAANVADFMNAVKTLRKGGL